MIWNRKFAWAIAGALLLAGALPAQEAQDKTPAEPPAEEPQEAVEEVIVVTASRTEQALNEAPAAISVLDSRTIEAIPADDYGDLLRNVPGLNVSQTSARDINMTSRGSTNTLSTSQLVLMDGRSLYLDFFGFVMWDFLPVNPNEIKQIEAVRGPGSAVWGANAMTGVVNLITKRPKEMVGTSLLFGGGELGTAYGSISHAGVSDKVGYKFSGGYYEQDAYDRPTGTIPGSNPPQAYPPFENQGTAQPKGDLRLDWDVSEGQFFTVGAGYAGTDGIIHTGIGPFDIDKGSDLSYGKATYTHHALNIGLFANFLDADSINLLTRGADGQPLHFAFSTDTYNLDIANSSVAGERNIFTYGGNYRSSNFDLEIAPDSEDKKEWGVFLQDEILLGEKVRWLIGGRYDDIDPLDSGVFTPRTSLLISPTPKHTFRISYNEAFRTPSAINSYLDVEIVNALPGSPYLVPARADGNVDLVEEHMTAYEVGYVGTFKNGVMFTLAAYRNEVEDTIDFFTAGLWGPGHVPPASATLPPQLVPCFNFLPGTGPAGCPLRGLGGLFPSDFSYRNIGQQTDQGVELTLNQRIGAEWNWFLNVSWQDTPEFEGLSAAEVASQNIAPEWRANAGLSFDNGPFFWSANVNYQDEAYWADVLNFRGFTDAFTQVNAAIGFRVLDERMSIQVIGSNLFDEEIQQHIFGDVISRKVTGQIGFRF